LVDVHHHVIPREYIERLSDKGVKKALGVQFPAWSADKALGVMDRNGISAAVVSISAPGVYFKDSDPSFEFAKTLSRETNEVCARLIADHPGRFGAFATLPLPDVEAALAELEHAMGTLKLDGVVLLSNYDGYYLGDPRFEKLFSELNRRKSVVFIHPASPPGIAQSHLGLPEAMMDVCFDTTRTAFSLIVNGVTRRYPDIRFILAHAGGAALYIAARIDILSSLFAGLRGPGSYVAAGLGMVSSIVPGLRGAMPENLDLYLKFKENMPDGPDPYLKRFYYDTALSASGHAFASLQTLVDGSKMLFGSDYPFATEAAVPATIAGVRGYAGFSETDVAAIERENATTLFPGRL